jgi:hypothetical protein
MALESAQRVHAAGIQIDPRARDRVARRVLVGVHGRDYFDGDRGGCAVDYEGARRTLPWPGVDPMYCDVAEHHESGMMFSFDVTS